MPAIPLQLAETSLLHTKLPLKKGKDMRFSKEKVYNAICDKLEFLEQEYLFNPKNGTSQLNKDDSQERIIAYGKYEVLDELLDELELG